MHKICILYYLKKISLNKKPDNNNLGLKYERRDNKNKWFNQVPDTFRIT